MERTSIDEYARSQGQRKTTAPDGTVFVHHANLTGTVTIVLAGGWASVSGSALLYLVNGPTLAEIAKDRAAAKQLIACPDCGMQINRNDACEACVERLTAALRPARVLDAAAVREATDAAMRCTHVTMGIRCELANHPTDQPHSASPTSVLASLGMPDSQPESPRPCPCDSSEARCETSEGWRCHNCATKIAARTGEWIADGNKVIMGANNSTYCEGGEDDYAAALEIVRTRRMAGLQK